MKKILKPISDFTIRQVTRVRYVAIMFNFIFAMITAVSVLLNFLYDTGITLRVRWYALIYFAIFVGGLLFAFIIEKLGSWQIGKRQEFNMSNVDLYRDQIEYSSLMIAEAMMLSPEERQKRILRLEKKLLGDEIK